MTKFQQIDGADVKVGDYVRIAEEYEAFKVTYEGLVRGASSTIITLGNDENTIGAWRVSNSSAYLRKLTIERRLPELPTAVGSAILIYDPEIMATAVATLRQEDAAYGIPATWQWAGNHRKVNGHDLDHNYIRTLFDAATEK